MGLGKTLSMASLLVASSGRRDNSFMHSSRTDTGKRGGEDDDTPFPPPALCRDPLGLTLLGSGSF